VNGARLRSSSSRSRQASPVPLLLLVLIAVAEVRPSDPSTRARSSGNQHVSLREVAALKTFERAVVRRNAAVALPTPDALLDGVPQCRAEWDGRGGRMQRIRQLLARSHQATLSPAQRMAAQLEELDAALLRFSTGANRRVADAVGFDSKRWFDAVRATLEAPIETPDYPGRRFIVQCADVAAAVATIARGEGRMLPALAWRGTVVDRAMKHGAPSNMSKSRRSKSRAPIPGAACPAASTWASPTRIPKPRCRSISSPARAASPRSCARSPRCSA
jgi:hypothetical protein